MAHGLFFFGFRIRHPIFMVRVHRLTEKYGSWREMLGIYITSTFNSQTLQAHIFRLEVLLIQQSLHVSTRDTPHGKYGRRQNSADFPVHFHTLTIQIQARFFTFLFHDYFYRNFVGPFYYLLLVQNTLISRSNISYIINQDQVSLRFRVYFRFLFAINHNSSHLS